MKSSYCKSKTKSFQMYFINNIIKITQNTKKNELLKTILKLVHKNVLVQKIFFSLPELPFSYFMRQEANVSR